MKRKIPLDILILLALGFLVFGLNLWGYPLFDVDEPRYAETAREMITSPGDWITPHFNWDVRFDKPVLFYWLIAGAYKLFGVSEFSARLVSALAATTILVMLYAVVKRTFSRRAGLITAGIAATMLEMVVIGRWAITDMTLTCFMVATWLSFFMVLESSPRWYLPAGIAAGLGLLTKGPVALALPGITFLLALGLHYRYRWRVLYSPWAFLGLALCFLIAMPWYVAVAKANPESFVGSFFFLHNVQRFTQVVSGHSGPWFYYIPVLLIGAMPWTLFLPVLVKAWYAHRATLPKLMLYSNLWFWVAVLFYSASSTKLLTYVLCAFPALALMLGWYWNATIEQSQQESPPPGQGMSALAKGLWVAVGLAGCLTGVSFAVLHRLLPENILALYQPGVAQGFGIVLVMGLGVSALLAHKANHRWRAFLAFQATWLVVLCYINVLVFPMVNRIFQTDMLAFAQRAVADKVPLATFDTKKPSLVFYTRRKVYYVSRDELRKPLTALQKSGLHEQARALYVIVKNKHLGMIAEHEYPYQLIQRGHVYSLIRTTTLLHKENHQ